MAKMLFLTIVLSLLGPPAEAQFLQVIGYSGHLGEWELTAVVTEGRSSRNKEFSGPLTMRQIGLCSREGPEERTGQMHLQLLASSSQLNATLVIAGVECSYSGRLSDSYNGMMNCSDRQAIPLKLWLK
jgi:hypothetical protein